MPGVFVHPQVRSCIIRLSYAFPISEIAILLGVSVSTCRRVIKLQQETGLLEPVKYKRGLKPILDNTDCEYLDNAIEENNDRYLDEYQDMIFESRGKRVSQATISRSIAKMGITNKQLTRAAAERDPFKRAAYSLEVGLLYETEQFVFIDECYIDKRNTSRLRGWAKEGERAAQPAPFVRGKRFTILPALSLDGSIDVRVFQGSCNSTIFVQFIQDLMAEMQPFPGKNSVLVMDNVPFHHNNAVQELATRRGVRLVYLSPYSPDYNPIEEGFSAVKAWVRRNNTMVRNAMEADDDETAAVMLSLAVTTVMTPENAKGWFADSGYF